jgi:hypothetical protein
MASGSPTVGGGRSGGSSAKDRGNKRNKKPKTIDDEIDELGLGW